MNALPALPAWRRHTLVEGGAAGLLSTALLVGLGALENKAPAAPLNAVSHWLWGEAALRRNAPSWRYTALGTVTNIGASLFWAALHALLLGRRGTATRAAIGAVGISALAAAVDLRAVPERLTPGFEHRLSQRSLVLFYATFAAGLLLGSVLAERRG